MGFFDTYDDGAGASFLTKEEKADFAKDHTPFDIVSVSKSPSRFEADKIQYTIRIVTEEGDERAMGFTSPGVESRDRLLDAMIAYIAEHPDETPSCYLEKSGRSYLIRAAE